MSTQTWTKTGNIKGTDGDDGLPGPTAVSTDSGNTAVLGSDSLIYVPMSFDEATGDTRYVNASGDSITWMQVVNDNAGRETLTVWGASGQATPLTSWRANSGNVVAMIEPDGRLTLVNVKLEAYSSGQTINDAMRVKNNGNGATFGVQNMHTQGFAGIEYIDNNGAIAVFTGYNNGSPGEFRFNNIAGAPANIRFLLNGTEYVGIRSSEVKFGKGIVIDAGPGAGVPLITMRTNQGQQVISSDGSSFTTFSSAISVPQLYTAGIGFTTVGAQVDMNGGSFVNLNRLTFSGSTGTVLMHTDYNAFPSPDESGFVHRYASRTASADAPAFQVYKMGDSTEKPILFSSYGYAWIKNSKTDKPILTLQIASGQTVDALRIDNTTGQTLSKVTQAGQIHAAIDPATSKGTVIGNVHNGSYYGMQGRAVGTGAGSGPVLMLGSGSSNDHAYLIGGPSGGSIYLRPAMGNGTTDWIFASNKVTAKTPLELPSDTTNPLYACTKGYADGKWTKWTGTQAEYDAIVTKDPNTLYVVV